VEAPPGFEECEQEEWLYNPSTKAWAPGWPPWGEIFWKFWVGEKRQGRL